MSLILDRDPEAVLVMESQKGQVLKDLEVICSLDPRDGKLSKSSYSDVGYDHTLYLSIDERGAVLLHLRTWYLPGGDPSFGQIVQDRAYNFPLEWLRDVEILKKVVLGVLSKGPEFLRKAPLDGLLLLLDSDPEFLKASNALRYLREVLRGLSDEEADHLFRTIHQLIPDSLSDYDFCLSVSYPSLQSGESDEEIRLELCFSPDQVLKYVELVNVVW